jgi:hypothetical protein
MTVETTPSGTYNPGNGYPTTPTYKIISVARSADPNTNLIVTDANTANLLNDFDFQNMSLAPTNVTSGVLYSVQINDPNLTFWQYYVGEQSVNNFSRKLILYCNSGYPTQNYIRQVGGTPPVMPLNITAIGPIPTPPEPAAEPAAEPVPTADASCFNEGTKILSLNKNLEEEYIPIEKLRKGDLVKSYKHGYRKIDLIGKNSMINDPNTWNVCMYKMEKTETNGLLEDVIITGGHSILVDDLGSYKTENDQLFNGIPQKIDDKYLLLAAVSLEFVKLENTNLYTYYHFTLENNGNDDDRFGVWANGILTETPSNNQFKSHNYILL